MDFIHFLFYILFQCYFSVIISNPINSEKAFTKEDNNLSKILCCVNKNITHNAICDSCPNNELPSYRIQDGESNLISATQIVMTYGTLTLGIITILILLWKLCSESLNARHATSSRARDTSGSSGSGGSLQRAVQERMRDAPPLYCRALPPPEDTPPPYYLSNSGYVNATFEGDLSVPPPDYSVIVGTSETSELSLSSSPIEEETQKSDESETVDNLGVKNDEVVLNASVLNI